MKFLVDAIWGPMLHGDANRTAAVTFSFTLHAGVNTIDPATYNFSTDVRDVTVKEKDGTTDLYYVDVADINYNINTGVVTVNWTGPDPYDAYITVTYIPITYL